MRRALLHKCYCKFYGRITVLRVTKNRYGKHYYEGMDNARLLTDKFVWPSYSSRIDYCMLTNFISNNISWELQTVIPSQWEMLHSFPLAHQSSQSPFIEMNHLIETLNYSFGTGAPYVPWSSENLSSWEKWKTNSMQSWKVQTGGVTHPTHQVAPGSSGMTRIPGPACFGSWYCSTPCSSCQVLTNRQAADSLSGADRSRPLQWSGSSHNAHVFNVNARWPHCFIAWCSMQASSRKHTLNYIKATKSHSSVSFESFKQHWILVSALNSDLEVDDGIIAIRYSTKNVSLCQP